MDSHNTLGFMDYLRTLGPFLGVLVAVGVGLMQYYLQRQKYQLDLFDKRFAAYHQVESYLCLAIGMGSVPEFDSKVIGDFVWEIKPAEFLFGSESLASG
jgi:hypothetical protein